MNKFISMFKYLFILSIFSIIICILLIILLTYFLKFIYVNDTNTYLFYYTGKFYFDNFFAFIDDFKNIKNKFNEIIYLYFLSLNYYSFEILAFKTVQLFPATYFSLYCFTGFLITIFFRFITVGYNKGELIFSLISIPFYILVILIYNEILEINFLRLNYNTRKNIKDRSLVETKNINDSETDTYYNDNNTSEILNEE